VHLRELGMHRTPDEQIFARALAEDRVVITFDLGFGDLAALTRDRPARVILFRLSNARTPHVIERLTAVLAGSADVLERPVIVLVEEARHRIRYLPIGEP
jgi:predicted nuclease of predicted toxin-antitoxin system